MLTHEEVGRQRWPVLSKVIAKRARGREVGSRRWAIGVCPGLVELGEAGGSVVQPWAGG